MVERQSGLAYLFDVANANHKPLVFIKCAVKSPPLSPGTRVAIGYFLREVQNGQSLGLPTSRPMPLIGAGVHELRLSDETGEWRAIY